MGDEYILRPHEYLIRKESEGPRDWRWHYVKKPLYFKEEDVVDVPRGSSYLAVNYIFRRKGWLIAARPEQLYAKPVKESLRECVRLMLDEDV